MMSILLMNVGEIMALAYVQYSLQAVLQPGRDRLELTQLGSTLALANEVSSVLRALAQHMPNSRGSNVHFMFQPHCRLTGADHG
jgi:hypothetical protein